MNDPKSEGGKDSAVEQDEDSIKEVASADSDAIEQADQTQGAISVEQAEKDAQADADSAPDPADDEPITLENVIFEKQDSAEIGVEISAPDPAEDEPIPAQTIDIVAPFGDNQISVIMYDRDNRISRVARTSKGTTLRFVLNEHERLSVTVADPTQHDEFLVSAEEDAAARG